MKVISCKQSIVSCLYLLAMSAGCCCNPLVVTSDKSRAGIRTPSNKFHLKTPTAFGFDDSKNRKNGPVMYDVTTLSSTPSDVTDVTVTTTVAKISTTNRTTGPATSSIAQASLYAGLVLFGVIIVIICLVATLVSTPDDDQPLQRRQCCRRLLRLGVINEPEASSSTGTSLSPQRRTAASTILYEPPPSYDEIMSVTGSNQNLVCVVDFPDSDGQWSCSLPADCSVVENSDASSSTSGCVCSTNNVSVERSGYSRDGSPESTSIRRGVADHGSEEDASTRAAVVTGGGFLRNAGRRFVNCISPPNYFQAIRDLASRGIFVNRAALTSPPPCYCDLRLGVPEQSQPWTTTSETAAETATTRATKLSPAMMPADHPTINAALATSACIALIPASVRPDPQLL